MHRLIPPLPLLAVLFSILLHGAVLVPAIGLLDTPLADRPTPSEQGSIELLPVEVVGADAATPADPSPPAEPAPLTSRPQVADIQEPPIEPPADPTSEDPIPRLADAQAGPVEPPMDLLAGPRPPAPASRPERNEALALRVWGTDSASNAVVSGPNLIPASPDDQSRNRPPVYPQDAVRRGLQGTVIVVIHVSSMGLADGVEVVASSGYRILDQAAVDAVLSWRFRPAVRDGRAIPFDMPMRFVFAAQ